jgi:hypothetical protein
MREKVSSFLFQREDKLFTGRHNSFFTILIQTHAVRHFSSEIALGLPFWGLVLPWLARAGAHWQSPPPVTLLPTLRAAAH